MLLFDVDEILNFLYILDEIDFKTKTQITVECCMNIWWNSELQVINRRSFILQIFF